ncbi:MAG TPA: glycosyltransferase [Ktedonobacterales bacterium]|nr:glycosyltransferase [Ktedonobacterales bacterium]
MTHPTHESTPSAVATLFVSVVVPVYNRPRHIQSCLRSLFAQTYPHSAYEIVVVDDGSTDDTAEVAREAGREWDGALSVVSQANGGPASARNAGIAAARGEVVAFIDSDCEADADWLEIVVGALRRACADGAGGPIQNVMPPGWIPNYLESANFFRHRARKGKVDYLLTANVAFRRSALLSVGGFTEREGAWGEDADLSFRLIATGHTLLLAPGGRVKHYGAPLSLMGLAKELYRYGYGNAVLSPGWGQRRPTQFEFVRHGAAVALSPWLALSYARTAGLLRAISFYPLIVLEHTAFMVGLARGVVRRERAGRTV